jgi:HAD superfamily hydrolase (TIGR01490 family)
MEPVLEEAIATLRGQSEDELRSRTLHFYETEVRSTLRPGVKEVLERHRREGDVIALLTSSSPYLSEAFQKMLDIPYACCNRFEVKDGAFTGEPIRPLCFGAGKLAHAQELAAKLGENLKDASFYTDSYSDLPVMERVGRPVAVHPDPSLLRAARKRGWEILDWGA